MSNSLTSTIQTAQTNLQTDAQQYRSREVGRARNWGTATSQNFRTALANAKTSAQTTAANAQTTVTNAQQQAYATQHGGVLAQIAAAQNVANTAGSIASSTSSATSTSTASTTGTSGTKGTTSTTTQGNSVSTLASSRMQSMMEARKMHVHQGLMPMSEANSHGQLDSASRGKDTKDSQSDTTLASQQGNGGELESSLTPDSQVNQDPTHDSSGKTLANSSTTQQYLQNNYRSSENASASSAPPTFTAWCQANGLAPLDASSTDPAAATKVST